LQIHHDGFLQLTYCTNIHPGEGWAAVDANVRRFAPALKARFSPDRPFGLGLRLSARDARELRTGPNLESFRSFLDAAGLYVALINGFPYGPFHGTPVKEAVYAPDWRDAARVAYTLDLVAILQTLLPDGLDGGISTAPLSYKRWMPDPSARDWETIARNVGRVAEALVRLRQQHGKTVHLDIEPEPDCLIENSDEAVDFFDRWLLPLGGPALAAACGIDAAAGRRHLLEHIRVCFDCCHAAVEYEDPLAALDRLRQAGIQVGRVQLSSALVVSLPGDPVESVRVADGLRPFADSTYLHQVIERRNESLRQFPDLGDALPHAGSDVPKEWRIHFHVPLFTREFGAFGSSQRYVQTVLEAALEKRFTRHLEIETYTWEVLPGDLKIDLLESIAREYEWVLGVIRSTS
jgi:sugar phosphate isomerase/epimerase